MPWRVTGTRERLYRVETPDDVSVWVDDEIESMEQGWMPLASELQPDGSMRVIYGRLPDELDEQPLDVQAVPAGGGIWAEAGQALTSLVILCLIAVAAVATFALIARDI